MGQEKGEQRGRRKRRKKKVARFGQISAVIPYLLAWLTASLDTFAHVDIWE